MMFSIPPRSVPRFPQANIGWGAHTLETTVNGSKGTMLLRVDLHGSVPIGETLPINFTELMQWADLPGKDTDLSAEEWFDALSSFPPLPDDAFENQDFRQMRGTSTTDQPPHLGVDSGIEIPLGGAMEGFTLTNAGGQDDVLYLRGYAKSNLDVLKDFRNSTFVNETTGDSLERMIGMAVGVADRDNNYTQPWAMEFEGVSSIEDLEGYKLMTEYGYNMHILAKGRWSFDIPLEYEKVVKTVPIDQNARLGTQDALIKQIDLSPYKATVKVVPSDKGQTGIDALSDFVMSDRLILEMNNGSTLELLNQTMFFDYSEIITEPRPVELVTLVYELEAVLDHEEVAAVVFGGVRYEVK
jgi:hypothetical protein